MQKRNPNCNLLMLAAVLDVSRECGEIVDDMDDTDELNRVQHMVVIPDMMIDNGYIAGSDYVPRSLVERMVLEHPPAPPLSAQLAKTPVSGAKLITDHVGAHLTKVDKVLFMQNNMGNEYWDIARKIAKSEIPVQFRYVFMMVGIDWCLTAKKFMVKESLKRMLYSINKITNGGVIVAVCGITPRYESYRETKCKTVTLNRILGDAERECASGYDRYRVAYLPLHLHVLH